MLTVLKWGDFNSADIWVSPGAEVYLRGGPDVQQRGPHQPLLQARRARREQVVHLGDQVESHISNRRSSDYIVEVKLSFKHCKIMESVSIYWTFVKFYLFSSFYNNHLIKDVKESIIKAVEGRPQNWVLKIAWLAINVCRGGCRDGGHVDDLHLVRVGQGEPGDLAWGSTWVLDCWSNGEGAGGHH